MYYVYPYAQRSEFQPVWGQNLQQSLALVKEAVQGERNDELFYDQLIKIAPSKEQADIIAAIRDDERGHNRMYRDIYRAFTGQEITGSNGESEPLPKSFVEGIQQALMGELAAVEKYRKIWSGLPAGPYKDTVLGIILDELKHAQKYNYLLTLYCTGGCNK